MIKFNFLISNPPYITLNDFKNLEKSVKKWEDKNALKTLDSNDLSVYNYFLFLINQNWFISLTSTMPILIVEIGSQNQATYLNDMLSNFSEFRTEVWKDSAHRTRTFLIYKN